MVAVDSGGLVSVTSEVIADQRVGSVILLGNSQAGASFISALTDDVRAAAKTPEGVRLMLAADQEGGRVQRLRGPGFDGIPSAEQQAELSDAALRRQAKTWGRQLKRAGIDANLAPVSDVVPQSLKRVNRPVGLLRRGYGSDPDTVAAKTAAFIAGMDKAKMATAVKHFPGLGRVRGNTDFEKRVVDSTTTRTDDSLRAFAGGISAGVDMVMVSSGTYAKIDAKHRAVFSSRVITDVLRGELGFDGVVISDDLAAVAVAGVAPGKRALKFLKAGGDLMIAGNPAEVEAMASAVRREVRDDADFARAVTEKVTRILEMKARRGLADC